MFTTSTFVIFLVVSVFANRRPENVSYQNVSSPKIVGYYSLSWGPGSRGPSDATMGVAFSGWVNPQQAISDYRGPALKGVRYCSVGGGNNNGLFTVDRIEKITASCNLFTQAGYQGICYDVEEVRGNGESLVKAFAESFATCKASGLKIFLTTSHSAPYKTDTPQDAVKLVKSWVKDVNIDILSPQLYSSGRETKPDFAETNNCKSVGCTWDIWQGSKAVIAPSLAYGNQYLQAVKGFSERNITIEGYVQWAQV